MAETFYGPWSLLVTAQEGDYKQRFTISRSDNSDGSFAGTVGAAVARIDGAQWSINLEWSSDNGVTWHDSAIRRMDEVTAADGLVVTLGADDNLPQLRDNDFNDLVVFLKCLDPDVNPPPPASIYDFTIPPDWIVGGHV